MFSRVSQRDDVLAELAWVQILGLGRECKLLGKCSFCRSCLSIYVYTGRNGREIYAGPRFEVPDADVTITGVVKGALSASRRCEWPRLLPEGLSNIPIR